MQNSATGKQSGKEGINRLRPHRMPWDVVSACVVPMDAQRLFLCKTRPWPQRNRQESDIPAQLIHPNPTYSIQHLAFGSIVLVGHGISHSVCPHEQSVPVVGAGKRKHSQGQSWPLLPIILGKNSSEHQHEQAG